MIMLKFRSSSYFRVIPPAEKAELLAGTVSRRLSHDSDPGKCWAICGYRRFEQIVYRWEVNILLFA